ncbi:hypothetical protein G9A89_005604 [Geosiphon pyriformis]|nr:hypothetical protein G9A89_005604 [Geosiphon pyriformis]
MIKPKQLLIIIKHNLITSLLFFKIPPTEQLISYQQPLTQQYQVLAQRLVQQNQFISQNQFQNNNNRINPNNHKVAALRSNPSNNIISPAQIAQNANLLDIFPFEFEANELLFLFSNAAVNKQKAITAMYTEAELMQQLQRTVNRPAQTVIVTANGIKKTPVEEIDNFPFTINEIIILIKVLVINAPQYQAFANTNLDWETQKLKILYQEQYTRVLAICGTFNKKTEKALVFKFEEKKELPVTETFMALGLTSNWAEKTEQEIFEKTKR